VATLPCEIVCHKTATTWNIYCDLQYTRTPPVEAALVVTYLEFPVQVRFPYSVGFRHGHISVTDTFLNLFRVFIVVGLQGSGIFYYNCITHLLLSLLW